MTRRQTELTIAALGATTAVNAVGGSVYGLSGAPQVPREWLGGSPFRDYRIPRLILRIAVGGSSEPVLAPSRRGWPVRPLERTSLRSHLGEDSRSSAVRSLPLRARSTARSRPVCDRDGVCLE